MQNLLVILTAAAMLVGTYSFISVIFPLKPFRTRRQAAKGLGACFIAIIGLTLAIGNFLDPISGDGEGAVARRSQADSNGSTSALVSATVSPNSIPAACGNGGIAILDEISVIDTTTLHSSAGGEKILNEKATAALGEPHFQNVDNTQMLQRVCAQDDWTEVKVLTPEWLKGVSGWIPSSAVRAIEVDQDGKRIFVEDDVYWDENSSKFKSQIVQILNRIIRENNKCESIDTGTVVLSQLDSKPGQPVFSVSCNSGRSQFNVTFNPNDADSGAKFAAIQPIGRSGAADACEAAAKAAANHPSTVSFSRLMDLSYQEYPSGRARIISSFTAKNGLGVKLRFRISCLFEGVTLIEAQVAEDDR